MALVVQSEHGLDDFSNFGSLKSTETDDFKRAERKLRLYFSNFGSLKSTETLRIGKPVRHDRNFSNFGSLKSTETWS